MNISHFQEATVQWRDYKIYSWAYSPIELTKDAPVIIMMHGAGTSDSARMQGLARAYAECGIKVVAFDFVGHGKTGADMSEMSLRLRTKAALAVIAHWTKPSDRLILCGFSMSGHTALMAAEQLGNRVQALSIMAPAVYAKAAEDVPFTEKFSTIIRRENSWQDSLALQSAAQFSGKVHMLMSSHDEVIPWGVVEHLLAAFRTNASEVRFDVLSEPGHKVALWLGERPERSRDILHYLLRA